MWSNVEIRLRMKMFDVLQIMWKRNARFSLVLCPYWVSTVEKIERSIWTRWKWKKMNVRVFVSDNHEFMVLVRLKFRGCLFCTRIYSLFFVSLFVYLCFSINVCVATCANIFAFNKLTLNSFAVSLSRSLSNSCYIDFRWVFVDICFQSCSRDLAIKSI